jgi:cyclopropane-fatty-acyl-phospholipid synthase
MCPCCNQLAEGIIKIEKYPLTEFYKKYENESGELSGFLDQELCYCEQCDHLFLEKIIDVREIYTNYLTTTTSSKGAIDCLLNFKKFIDKKLDVENPTYVIDIGGNDSYFLGLFDKSKFDLVNIDANAEGGDGINIIRSFLEDIDLSAFSKDSKIIVSSHTIEHLQNPADLIKKIAAVVSGNDRVFLQFPSLEMMVTDARFDQVCHQHLNYFSLSSISKLLKNYGLKVMNYEYDSSHFGTLRIMAKKSNALDEVFAVTQNTSLKILNRYSGFREYYSSLQNILQNKLNRQQGFGAGLMVPTLAYYLPLINDLEIILDESASKFNMQFINLAPKICDATMIDTHRPIIITSISTKTAARNIYAKLSALGCEDITIPTHLS